MTLACCFVGLARWLWHASCKSRSRVRRVVCHTRPALHLIPPGVWTQVCSEWSEVCQYDKRPPGLRGHASGICLRNPGQAPSHHELGSSTSRDWRPLALWLGFSPVPLLFCCFVFHSVRWQPLAGLMPCILQGWGPPDYLFQPIEWFYSPKYCSMTLSLVGKT